MFDLLVSWLLGLGSPSQDTLMLQSAHLSRWFAQVSLNDLMEPLYVPDAGAIATLEAYLDAIEQMGLDPTQQGVWLQSGAKVWGANQGTVPLPAASLTKLVTSLATLTTWGTDHQFETLVSTTGIVRNGVLEGDLVIQGGGDPLYVWEEAIAMANALQQLGIQRIDGELLISGNFSMNFNNDPIEAGLLLKQAFNAARWHDEVIQQYQQMPSGTPQPSLVISGSVRFVSSNALSDRQPRPLLRHYSLPLAQLLKLMNSYSNNTMAQNLVELVGGADRAAQIVATATHVPQAEIQIINGSGLGHENQLSPRAICRILMAMSREVEGTPWSLADLLPVSGQVAGTLAGRQLPPATAAKTGSLWDVSSLAGAFPSQERGVVWFVIINRGSDLDTLRQQQDIMLNALVKQWGNASVLPKTLQLGHESTKLDNQLGASSRIQILDNLPLAF